MFLIEDDKIIEAKKKLINDAVLFQNETVATYVSRNILQVFEFTRDETWLDMEVMSDDVIEALGRERHLMQFFIGEHLAGKSSNKYIIYADDTLTPEDVLTYTSGGYLYVSFYRAFDYENVKLVVIKNEYMNYYRNIGTLYTLSDYDDLSLLEVYDGRETLTPDLDYMILDGKLYILKTTTNEISILTVKSNDSFKIESIEDVGKILPSEGYLFANSFRYRYDDTTYTREFDSGEYHTPFLIDSIGGDFKPLQIKIKKYVQNVYYDGLQRDSSVETYVANNIHTLGLNHLSSIDIKREASVNSIIDADLSFAKDYYKSVLKYNKVTRVLNPLSIAETGNLKIKIIKDDYLTIKVNSGTVHSSMLDGYHLVGIDGRTFAKKTSMILKSDTNIINVQIFLDSMSNGDIVICATKTDNSITISDAVLSLVGDSIGDITEEIDNDLTLYAITAKGGSPLLKSKTEDTTISLGVSVTPKYMETDDEYIFGCHNPYRYPVDFFYNRKLIQKFSKIVHEDSVTKLYIPKTLLPEFNQLRDVMVSIVRQPDRYRRDYSFTPVNAGYVIIDFDPNTVSNFEVFVNGLRFEWGTDDWDVAVTYTYRNNKHYLFFNRVVALYDYCSVMYGNYITDISTDYIEAVNINVDERYETYLNGLLLIEGVDYNIVGGDIYYSESVSNDIHNKLRIIKMLPTDITYVPLAQDYVDDMIVANPDLLNRYKPTGILESVTEEWLTSIGRKKHSFFTTEMDHVSYKVLDGNNDDTYITDRYSDIMTAKGNIVISGHESIFPRVCRTGYMIDFDQTIYVNNDHFLYLNGSYISGFYYFWDDYRPILKFMEGSKPIQDGLITWLDGSYGTNTPMTLVWVDKSEHDHPVTLQNFDDNLNDGIESGWTGSGLIFDTINDYLSDVYIPEDSYDITVCANFSAFDRSYEEDLITLSNPVYSILMNLTDRDNDNLYDLALRGTLLSFQLYNRILSVKEIETNFLIETEITKKALGEDSDLDNSYYVLTLTRSGTTRKLQLFKKSMDGTINLYQTN
jgi:hypothetical protein